MTVKQCVICNSKAKTLRTNMPTTIYQCCNCGLQWTDLPPKLEHIKVDHVKSLEVLAPLRKYNNAVILKQIGKMLPIGAKGLEVGSGIGVFMRQAEEVGYVMTGIEPVEDGVQAARICGLNVIHGFFPQDFHLDEKYDFIIFNDVFEHIPDSQTVLMACQRVLLDKGLLIINCPMSTGILYRIAMAFNNITGNSELLARLWQSYSPSPHLHYFNDMSIKYIAKKFSFNFLKAFPVKTYTLNGLIDRIKLLQNQQKILQLLAWFLLVICYPLFMLLPADVKCFIFASNRESE